MLSDTMMLGGGRKAAYPIENSLLFRNTGADPERKMSRIPKKTSGNKGVFTISAWIRAGAGAQLILAAGNNYNDIANGTVNLDLICHNGIMARYYQIGGSDNRYADLWTTAVVNDPGGWLHVVWCVDTFLGAESERVKLFWNGTRVPLLGTYPSKGYAFSNLCTADVPHAIGTLKRLDNGVIGEFLKGYLAEMVFVDGTALEPSTFGETDPVTGSWRPKKAAGIAYGANGFQLGNPWNAADLGTDFSGKGNTWTPSGFVAADVVKDSPTNVYATLNPLVLTGGSLSEGNLKLTGASGSFAFSSATVPMDTGKWFFEFTVDRPQETNDRSAFGIAASGRLWTEVSSSSVAVSNLSGTIGFENNTEVGTATNLSMYSGSHVAGDVYGFLVDIDGNTVTIQKNGTLFMAATGLPLSGKKWWPYVSNGATAGKTALIGSFNFGQHPFAHPPSVDAKSLSTVNLPATTGVLGGSFTGNADADGPCVYTGAVPQTLTINGTHEVTWGVHADKLATGFKIRTADGGYNGTGDNSWAATYDRKPTVGPKGRAPANAQINP